jgi:TatD DNase family protein
MLIDSHAHVNFAAFKDDSREVIKRSLDNDIWMINVGSQISTSERAVKMANEYESGVYAAVGLHPIQLQKRTIEYVDDYELTPEEIKTSGEEFEYEKYLELSEDKKVVTIGEVGLDYKHFEEGDDIPSLVVRQKEILLEFIKIANEVRKTLMIHCWGNLSETNAYDDLLEILRGNIVEKKGVIHSFCGGYKTANKFIELGYKIGLNGMITYSESYDRLIREIDLKNIILETDCPYLTPVPHKGERNEPLLVKYVADKIAEVRGVETEEVARITTQNARKLFGI